MCPLCTAGAAIGLGIARYYGVDDLVIGLWLGALAVSTALWINSVVNNQMNKRKLKPVPFQGTIVFIAMVAATIVPFYFAGFFKGMPGMSDTIFGTNRLVVGTIIGGIVTFGAPSLSNFIKRMKKAVFPYQTVILTFGILVILSVLFWYITKYYYIV